MILLCTKLPIKDEFTKFDCFELYKEWVTKSQHYSFGEINYSLDSYEDYEKKDQNATFTIKNYKDSEKDIFACRLEIKSEDSIWSTVCVFLQESGKKNIFVELNCNRLDYNSKLPQAHKPYIVKNIIEKEICKSDSDIVISDKPNYVCKEDIDLCASIMNGSSHNSLPVVYLSLEKKSQWTINPEILAKELSGLAHVFVEKDKDLSWKLKEKTNSRNAHSGYIGIYFPQSTSKQVLCLDYYNGDNNLLYDNVVDSVWKALSNRQEAAELNWNQIQTMQLKQKMSKTANEELMEYITTFDVENKRLQEQVQALNKDNYELKYQLFELREAAKINRKKDAFYLPGKEEVLYSSERNDLLYSILSQTKGCFKEGSRGYVLIESMLEANPKIGECEQIINNIKGIFKNGETLNSADKSKLYESGFIIQEDGTHYKLKFHDDRYIFPVSKTPSDHRGGKNLCSDISNMINIEKKIF